MIEGECAGENLRIALVASRFNQRVVQSLVHGAVEALANRGVARDAIDLVYVPGAWEIPLALRELARARRHDALVALGAVIRGATRHFDYVAGECARGVQQVSLDTGVPVGFGVLTVDTAEQAWERAGPAAEHNKGAEAALVALEMSSLLRRLRR